MNFTEMNFEEMCRTCLRSGEMMSSLFDEEIKSAEHTAADLLAMFTSVQIDKEDDFPQNICNICLKQIQQAYSFNLKCKESETILHQIREIRANLKILKEISKQNKIASEGTGKLESNIKEHFKSEEIMTLSDRNISDVESNVSERFRSVEEENANATENLNLQIVKEECDHNNHFMEDDTHEKELERIKMLSNFQIVEKGCDPEFQATLKQEPDHNNPIIRNNAGQNELELNQNSSNFVILDECAPAYQVIFKTEADQNNLIKENTNQEESEFSAISSNLQIVEKECVPDFHVAFKTEPELDIGVDCNDEQLQCSACLKQFESLDMFRDHIVSDHLEENICNLCNQEFECSQFEHSAKHLPLDYKEHMEIEHNEKSRHGETLNGHMKAIHNDEFFGKSDNRNEEELVFSEISSNFQIATEECVPDFNVAFETEPELDIGVDCNDEQLKCSACLKQFESLDMFRGHIVSDHLEENFCNLCNQEFECSQFEHSAKHLPFSCLVANKPENPSGASEESIRQTEKLQSTVKFCQHCSMHFEDLNMLRMHVSVEHSELKLKCSVCEQNLADDRSDYDDHMKIEHNDHIEQTTNEQSKCDDTDTGKKQFPCLICPNESFELKKELSEHNRKYHYKSREQCTECFVTLSQKNLLSHMKTVHNCEKPFACELCGALYQRNHGLNLHITAVHDKSYKGKMQFQCALCKEKFPQNKTLKEHMKEIHKDDIQCTICSKVFTRQCRLINHVRTHTGEKPFDCELCPKKFGNNSELKRHIRKNHTENMSSDDKPKQNLQCIICYEVFDMNNKLRSHMHSHIGEKPFQCKSCPGIFQRIQALQIHMQAKHTDQGTEKTDLKCNICSKVFVFEHNLSNHMHRKHAREKQFQCTLCSRNFRTSWSLDSHMRKQHSSVFKCTDCFALFASKHLLIRHMRIHNARNPVQCEFCPEKFIGNRPLRIHVQTKHPDNWTGEPDYKCAICSKVFGFKHNLTGHMYTHTGEYPFRCQICLKIHRSKISLAEHMKWKHNHIADTVPAVF